ncbi:hypothetical protein NDU88_002816 [Pleurodeles waltl]|uniref:Uncharacterized protein n=1 Tax=Pleurodeles waltl TaxID=8319 RepID=A0AAV7M533_PLEWA|nr:hypothetical protein NDU88_002816 [Pleurodeles waltl]
MRTLRFYFNLVSAGYGVVCLSLLLNNVCFDRRLVYGLLLIGSGSLVYNYTPDIRQCFGRLRVDMENLTY